MYIYIYIFTISTTSYFFDSFKGVEDNLDISLALLFPVIIVIEKEIQRLAIFSRMLTSLLNETIYLTCTKFIYKSRHESTKHLYIMNHVTKVMHHISM